MKKIRKIKKNSLAQGILKGVAIAGVIMLAASSPYFGLNIIRGIKRHNNKKEWRKFYASLRYLDRRGYVKILDEDNDGKLEVKITRLGEDIIKRVNIEEMKLKEQETWDSKWRIVIFDIPIRKSNNRHAFAENLKNLGFIMIQKSVWAYPFECREEVMILRKFYEVERYVVYFEGVEIEDEIDWRGKFNLSYQSKLKIKG